MHYFFLLLNSEYNPIDLDKIIKASCIYVVVIIIFFMAI